VFLLESSFSSTVNVEPSETSSVPSSRVSRPVPFDPVSPGSAESAFFAVSPCKRSGLEGNISPSRPACPPPVNVLVSFGCLRTAAVEYHQWVSVRRLGTGPNHTCGFGHRSSFSSSHRASCRKIRRTNPKSFEERFDNLESKTRCCSCIYPPVFGPSGTYRVGGFALWRTNSAGRSVTGLKGKLVRDREGGVVCGS
jgi:hypothetical protein